LELSVEQAAKSAAEYHAVGRIEFGVSLAAGRSKTPSPGMGLCSFAFVWYSRRGTPKRTSVKATPIRREGMRSRRGQLRRRCDDRFSR
jgi:hypothetical protein